MGRPDYWTVISCQLVLHRIMRVKAGLRHSSVWQGLSRLASAFEMIINQSLMSLGGIFKWRKILLEHGSRRKAPSRRLSFAAVLWDVRNQTLGTLPATGLRQTSMDQEFQCLAYLRTSRAYSSRFARCSGGRLTLGVFGSARGGR
jgi:hypothetical protein